MNVVYGKSKILGDMKMKGKQNTHLSASERLLGKTEIIETGRYSEISLTINEEMVVDDKGLGHGGFTFGLADYASMVAVNHPYVVLVSSNVKFLKPVVRGDRLRAKAQVVEIEGRNLKVWCEVLNQNAESVFQGEFFCISISKHVLDIQK